MMITHLTLKHFPCHIYRKVNNTSVRESQNAYFLKAAAAVQMHHPADISRKKVGPPDHAPFNLSPYADGAPPFLLFLSCKSSPNKVAT
jgi:hypothetical protein